MRLARRARGRGAARPVSARTLVRGGEPAELEVFFRRSTEAQIYALADLDEPLWSRVTAWSARRGGSLVAVALRVDVLALPLLHCVAPPDDPDARWLLERVAGEMPRPFFATVPLGVAAALGPGFASEGVHRKLVWRPRELPPAAVEGLCELGPADFEELAGFYAERAYAADDPGTPFFERDMLETGPYLGVRRMGVLVAAAGVHVRSPSRRVAAIGNLATAPSARRQGLARALTSELCRRLRPGADAIGLNVHAGNAAALACYASLGFEPVLDYEEGHCPA